MRNNCPNVLAIGHSVGKRNRLVNPVCGCAAGPTNLQPFAQKTDFHGPIHRLVVHFTGVPLPAYYSSLNEFHELFRSGNPILTYHKLGPRPIGVRLKGLYVSASLFARQLEELRQAGWQSGSLDSALAPPAAKRVVITFDDGYANVLRNGLQALQSSRFTAIQFLVADFLGSKNAWDIAGGEHAEPLMDAAQIREWLAAGHEIGAHTCTHPFLTRIPRCQAGEEISSSKKKLEDRFGRPVNHFCYPYGQWNEPVRDLVMQAGFKTACTTDSGVNSPGDSPYTLKRLTARYRSRNARTIWATVRRLLSACC